MATAASTRIRSSTVVRLTPECTLPSPAKLQVSFFDTFFLSFPSIKTVLLYPDASLPFATAAANLKSALERVLPHFYVYGGTVALDGDDVVIDCSDVGIKFIEAETDLDMGKILASEVQEKGAFFQLAPVIDGEGLPAPAMALQLTEFPGTGLALTIEVHHGVADGRGLWLFIDALKQACREGAEPTLAKPPVHDRTAITNGPAAFVKGRIPRLFKATEEESRRLERRIFVLTAEIIQSLKKKLGPSGGKPPSTFSAVTAHAWLSMALAKGITDVATFGLIFFADCRARLSPPVDDAYTGNCVAPAYVKLTGADLAGPDGLSLAHNLIKGGVDAANADPKKYVESFSSELAEALAGRPMLLTGSPRFSGLGTEFGWGAPARCDFASFDYDGEVLLGAGKVAGGVEAVVTLTGDRMKAFAEAFVGSN